MTKYLKKWESVIREAASKDDLSLKVSRRIISELISSKENIKSILIDILSDQEYLEYVASRSYAHNNGFDKFVLLVSEDPPFKLRLHVWWDSNERSNKEHIIHNHSWNFSSALLSGAMQFEIFQLQDNGIEAYHYNCEYPVKVEKGEEINKSDQGYQANYLGISKVNCVFDTTLSAGSSYSLSFDQLHRIRNKPNEITSTMMLHGKFLRTNSDLLSVQPIVKDRMTVNFFTIEEVTNKLDKYIKMVLEP